jgi:hypothetical protein
MVSAESNEGFRVTDRRRRAEDEDSPTPAPRPEPPKVEPPKAETSRVESPRPSRPPQPGREATGPGRHQEPPPGHSIEGAPLVVEGAPRAAEGVPPGGERSLAGLFVMLASSAAMALGEVPDPLTGQVHRDLDQAADIIDLLILLREKTEGNRSPEETQILDEILYDLQIRYVSATKRGARPPGPARS